MIPVIILLTEIDLEFGLEGSEELNGVVAVHAKVVQEAICQV